MWESIAAIAFVNPS